MSTTTATSTSQTASKSGSSSGPAKLLAHPVDTMTAAVDHMPGASVFKGVANGVLDTVGIVSPHARRVAAYAGVGLLGAAGIVEWPVAAVGAAVVWLTQQRPKEAEAAASAAAGHGTGASRTARTRPSSGAAAKKAKTGTKASSAGGPGRRTTSSRKTSSGRTGSGRQA
ncbi:hypothetical protein NGB36_31615 [Streptomyces sp. RB6PN25]|uniref:Uncharacterized protein n=1 Tax=Streptomyces humicola TaxID=2953240 RepID=A0ABT1Q4Y4_9ACTN|nr:hypothetical protein [Streptomyces humicola]MCQ4084988.1 hypothetical protein [Streptomyces humicola]